MRTSTMDPEHIFPEPWLRESRRLPRTMKIPSESCRMSSPFKWVRKPTLDQYLEASKLLKRCPILSKLPPESNRYRHLQLLFFLLPLLVELVVAFLPPTMTLAHLPWWLIEHHQSSPANIFDLFAEPLAFDPGHVPQSVCLMSGYCAYAQH